MIEGIKDLDLVPLNSQRRLKSRELVSAQSACSLYSTREEHFLGKKGQTKQARARTQEQRIYGPNISPQIYVKGTLKYIYTEIQQNGNKSRFLVLGNEVAWRGVGDRDRERAEPETCYRHSKIIVDTRLQRFNRR